MGIGERHKHLKSAIIWLSVFVGHAVIFWSLAGLVDRQRSTRASPPLTALTIETVLFEAPVQTPKEPDDFEPDTDLSSEKTEVAPGTAVISTEEIEPNPSSAEPSDLAGSFVPTMPSTTSEANPERVEGLQGSISAESGVPDGVQNTLRNLSCLRLGQSLKQPECSQDMVSAQAGPLEMQQPAFWETTPITENPFASALDIFTAKQYADRTTPYSIYQPKSAKHQHANPFFSPIQSSAQRDLTGSLNSSPDPVWGD